ncbi:MAG: MBL fold metallo-hydrolase [Saprospiraceae bacterium]|nr:MBL fold metallo-hydrolase [Saprospiraceae bacterium]MCF8251894.1 MBL fold metallo-hydrolase [Saprospiraceae bacterium]MCF8281613.1 MBL fold metallo-hydrolase [Bacteroidales bacterium]MCF8313590.1 MBL fold metallo-hydrolase [Saprospiraceae bacterium]MCF8442278.1 MBL fold metallo-hydrolase [Saprospiraceae bacterium]
MKIEQIYTGCLAQGAYYIESNGEAVVIDPLREVQPYLERAKQDGAKIKYVLETHFHADFVSGHIDLAKETGAKIVYGPNAKTGFEAHIATDGEVLKVGNISIKVLHTPGHTMESTCYLLFDENGKESAIFSGDTLFIGDVGRPDLAQKSTLTMADLAGHLYDSLRNKVMTLPDEVTVYPAHGAGSACGKNMSKETVSTIGAQKANNYALRANMTKAEFVHEVTDGLLAPPRYFPENVRLNKEGYESFEAVMKRSAQALSPRAFEEAVNATGALMLDVRHENVFYQGFIPNSIFIGLDGQFAPWAGALVADVNLPLLLIVEPGREEEAITRLSRVGFDNVLGYLAGGFEAWKTAGMEVDSFESISANELAVHLEKYESKNVLDVRKPSEFAAEHIKDVESVPLDFINEYMGDLDKQKKYFIHCAGGYRSMIAASILKSRGFMDVVDVKGGFTAIQESGKFEMTDYVCPNTLRRQKEKEVVVEDINSYIIG